MRLRPVGEVSRVGGDRAVLMIYEKYRECLEGLEDFSHVWVIWWGHESDRSVTRVRPLHGEAPVIVGVFASRSPDRPNPVLLTLCRLVDLDAERGRVEVEGIDAREGSPVIDLKPYIPDCDGPEGEVRLPGWLKRARRPPRTRSRRR
ncbi:MAG: tRNA (N6-threonylcarbamoyladenosine(37)-N6)-methyltransferase TrmO [Methanopyraceae archaeon]